MEFSHKKYTPEDRSGLKPVAIQDVRPHVFLPAPAYVYLEKNAKFVSIKAPLDFFSVKELERIKPLGTIYFPKFIEKLEPIQERGRSLRDLLKKNEMKPYSLPEFEVSDSVLKKIAELWSLDGSSDLKVEPFFVAVFVESLCEPLPEALLISAKEKNVKLLDEAALASSWAVFIGLHQGFFHLGFLNDLRKNVFERVIHGTGLMGLPSDVADVVSLAFECGHGFDAFEGRALRTRQKRVPQKLASRLERVATLLKQVPRVEMPTIFGPEGLVDV